MCAPRSGLVINRMTGIHITDIEAAINWWRARRPSPDGITACPEVLALAEIYALMVYYHDHEADEKTMPSAAREAWLTWYRSTPDAPCIAICSTSQGDDICKGCGRTFDEVQHWPGMSPAENAWSGAASHSMPKPGGSIAMPNVHAKRPGKTTLPHNPWAARSPLENR